MIIDFHTHTFPKKIAEKAIKKLSSQSHIRAYTDGTPEDLERSAVNAGVDLAVVQPVATNPDKVPNINDVSIENTGRGRLMYFGCMHPDYPGYRDELKRIAQAGIKGIKLHPVSQNRALDNIKYLRILEECGKLGLIALIHAGIDLGKPGVNLSTPDMAVRAAEQVGPVKMVMAHMGGHLCWQDVPKMAQYENIYIDTSTSLGEIEPIDDHYGNDELMMLTESRFIDIVRAFSADRVLFATDSPWGDQKREIDNIKKLPLTNDELEKILGGNAVRLLKI